MSLKDDNVQIRREIADITLRLNDIRSTAAGVHALVGPSHTAAGLTPGDFLKALTPTTFGFTAHGLTYTDVGAAAAGHTHAGVYEPAFAAGTSAQYLRGDKSWQTLNQAAVAGLTTASSPQFAGLTLTGNISISWATWQLEERYNAFWWWGIYFNEPARSLTFQIQSNDSGGNIYLLPSTVSSVGYVYTGSLRQAISATAYRLRVATATNIMGELAAVGATGEYLAGSTGAIPVWATLNQAAISGLTTGSSPIFVTVKCSGLGDGYMPYHVSDVVGLADSGLYYNAGLYYFFSTVAGYDIYFNGDSINTHYATNLNASLYINYYGYNNGSSQFRDLFICDGKGATLAFFDGSVASIAFGGITTFTYGEKYIFKGGAYNSIFANADYTGGAAGAGLFIIFGAASGSTYTRLCALNTGGTNWGTMTLQDGGGAVAIGTTATIIGTEQLVVSNSAAADTGGIVIYNRNTSGYGSRLVFYGGLNSGYSYGVIESENSSTGGSLRIYTADTSKNLQRAIQINELQYMSVGTGQNPLFRLHIGGGAGSNYVVVDTGANGGSDYAALYGRNASTTALWKIAGNAQTGAFAIGVGGSYDERIQIDYGTGLINITAAIQSPVYWIGPPVSTYGGKLYIAASNLIYCGIPGTAAGDLFYFITSAGSGAFYITATGNIYGEGNCSFLTFTDRTPYPKDTAEAWAAVKSVKGDGKGSLDHAALHSSLAVKTKEKHPTNGTEKEVMGRNLSATVSALLEALKDADDRISKLEKKNFN